MSLFSVNLHSDQRKTKFLPRAKKTEHSPGSFKSVFLNLLTTLRCVDLSLPRTASFSPRSSSRACPSQPGSWAKAAAPSARTPDARRRRPLRLPENTRLSCSVHIPERAAGTGREGLFRKEEPGGSPAPRRLKTPPGIEQLLRPHVLRSREGEPGRGRCPENPPRPGTLRGRRR